MLTKFLHRKCLLVKYFKSQSNAGKLAIYEWFSDTTMFDYCFKCHVRGISSQIFVVVCFVYGTSIKKEATLNYWVEAPFLWIFTHPFCAL